MLQHLLHPKFQHLALPSPLSRRAAESIRDWWRMFHPIQFAGALSSCGRMGLFVAVQEARSFASLNSPHYTLSLLGSLALSRTESHATLMPPTQSFRSSRLHCQKYTTQETGWREGVLGQPECTPFGFLATFQEQTLEVLVVINAAELSNTTQMCSADPCNAGKEKARTRGPFSLKATPFLSAPWGSSLFTYFLHPSSPQVLLFIIRLTEDGNPPPPTSACRGPVNRVTPSLFLPPKGFVVSLHWPQALVAPRREKLDPGVRYGLLSMGTILRSTLFTCATRIIVPRLTSRAQGQPTRLLSLEKPEVCTWIVQVRKETSVQMPPGPFQKLPVQRWPVQSTQKDILLCPLTSGNTN